LLGAALSLIAASAAAGCGSSKAVSAAAPSGMRDTNVPSCAMNISGSAAYAMGPQDDPTVVVVMGRGENGLVLAPMSNGNYCQWRAQAKHFVEEGYRVASLSWAKDRAASVELAAQLLYHEGAKKLALLGGSIGGSVVVAVAPELKPEPVGVVTLSAAISAGPLHPLTAAAKYGGPMLTIGNKDDGVVSIDDVKSLAAAHHNSADKMVELPGSTHGTDMFAEEPTLIGQIDGFLRNVFS
jgi:pimeloyl-ACP methyl ester carboxylesterase